jgi:molecular chaperone GrpE
LLDITKNDEDNSESGIEDSKSLKKQIKNDTLEGEENSGIVDSEVLKSEIQFLKDELEKEKEISEKNLSRLRYLMADFDNYRKQIGRQTESRIEENKGQLLLKLLKVYDDCVLALETIKNGQYDSTLLGGISGIMTNFESLMKEEGMLEIETLGTPFDPNVHDAIGFVTNELAPDNTIVEVVRKGYMLNNKVLRPSSVILSKRTVTNKDINEKEKE